MLAHLLDFLKYHLGKKTPHPRYKFIYWLENNEYIDSDDKTVFSVGPSHCNYSCHPSGHRFIQFLKVLRDGGSPQVKCNFLYSFKWYNFICFQHLSKNWKANIKKYVTIWKIFSSSIIVAVVEFYAIICLNVKRLWRQLLLFASISVSPV